MKLSQTPAPIIAGLELPPKATHIRLMPTASKTLRLGGASQKMTVDGMLAFELDGLLTCVALQAEYSTALNISSLMGKSSVSLLCQDPSNPILVDVAVPPPPRVGGRGPQPTRDVARPTPVKRVVVVFLHDQASEKGAAAMAGVVATLSSVTNPSRPELHIVSVNRYNVIAAIGQVQSIVDGL